MSFKHQNNFDFLRFTLASLVFLAHFKELNTEVYNFKYLNFISSALVIKCFFIISGYLITSSFYSNDFNLKKYFLNRFARIYPAYFAVVISCFILLSFTSKLNPIDYFTNQQNLKYLICNLLFANFLQPDIQGVFTNNYISAVNGSLWTIKIEVMFYITLPVLIIFLKKMSLNYIKISLAIIYLISTIYSYYFNEIHNSATMSKLLPNYMNLFACGIFCFYIRENIKKYSNWFILPALGILFIERYFELFPVFTPICLTFITMCIAYNFSFLNTFGKYGDFSYGLYLIHFPVIQTILECNFLSNAPFLKILFTFILILILSILSWNYLEKPILLSVKKLNP